MLKCSIRTELGCLSGLLTSATLHMLYVSSFYWFFQVGFLFSAKAAIPT